MKFCFIIQATGRHYNYVVDLINSIECFFCSSHDRKIIVFTDQNSPNDSYFKSTSGTGAFVSIRPPLGNTNTCLRIFDYVLAEKNAILEHDFAYKMDADMLVCDHINPEEIIGKPFTGIQHFNNWTQNDNNYVPNTCSAFIPENQRNTPSWQSCIFGGETKSFIQMSEELKQLIDLDVTNNVHWGAWEEPYVNWYFNKHVDKVKTISPNYAAPIQWYKFPQFFRDKYNLMTQGLSPRIYHFNATAWNHAR